MQISLSHHRSLELFSVFSVALLLLCGGTWLVKLVENLGLRPPLFLFRRHSRGALWYDLCYRRTVVVSSRRICYSYECISVCSMPIAVNGNALTIVFFFPVNLLFFAPFEAGIYPGITRTRHFWCMQYANRSKWKCVDNCVFFTSQFVVFRPFRGGHSPGNHPYVPGLLWVLYNPTRTWKLCELFTTFIPVP